MIQQNPTTVVFRNDNEEVAISCESASSTDLEPYYELTEPLSVTTVWCDVQDHQHLESENSEDYREEYHTLTGNTRSFAID